MVAQIMGMLNNSFSAAGQWFLTVFTRSGVVDLYLAFLFIVFAIKFILTPIFGSSRGSDKARTNKEDNDG